MRKYIIGFMVGGALTFALQAGAASLLGSTVDAVITVEVDGENLGQAPVIDGVSYLPVRKLGEAVGYEVDFGEGKATLTNEEPVAVAPAVEPTPTPTIDPAPSNELVYTLLTIDGAIKNQEDAIYTAKITVNAGIANGIDGEKKAKLLAGLDKMEQELERLKAIKAQLELTP